MRSIVITCARIFICVLLVGLAACSTTERQYHKEGPAALASKALRRFRSMAEFEAYLKRVDLLAAASKRESRVLLAQNGTEPCNPMVEDCGEPQLDEVVMTASKRSSAKASITNTQEADVDEGDIVKQFGRFLIVLQDGRLFSVDTGTAPGSMRLVDRIDIYTSGSDDTWYDELLIYRNKLVVTGYNYRDDASELNVFTIDERGEFSFDVRYYIESEDYYSGENYASRLVRGQFMIYTPLYLEDGLKIPRIRSWSPTAGHSQWQPLFDITNVYRPIQETLRPVLHAISICRIESGENFGCSSRGIVGTAYREFYVSSSNVYLWLSADREEWDRAFWRSEPCPEEADLYSHTPLPAALFQLAVDSPRVRAAHTIGMPHDQFAFDERDDHLFALLRREPEECYLEEQLPMMLARIPFASLSAWPRHVPSDAYHRTPIAHGDDLQTRYSETHVVYGSPQGYWRRSSEVHSGDMSVVSLSRQHQADVLSLPHSIERIELIGGHVVAVGLHGEADLGVSTVRLDAVPRVSDSIVLPDIRETEGRSHAFNSLVDHDGIGLWGVPTIYREHKWWRNIPSDIQFFSTDRDLRITRLGELAGQSNDTDDYTCETSCEDWYGNARPIFIDQRVFALTGSELIEGQPESSHMVEVGRLRLTGVPERRR